MEQEQERASIAFRAGQAAIWTLITIGAVAVVVGASVGIWWGCS
jgi:hypothetical protein